MAKAVSTSWYIYLLDDLYCNYNIIKPGPETNNYLEQDHIYIHLKTKHLLNKLNGE